MKRLLLLLFFFINLPLIAGQYEDLRVASIDIVPENLPEGIHFDAKAVRARMRTKIGNLFSQKDFDDDLKMLADEYDHVFPTLYESQGKLCIRLDIGLKPTIRDIYFCGNERVATKKLQKELDLTSGSTFEREEFIKSFNKLRHLYLKKGYFESELDHEIVPVGNSNCVDIYINISEGRAGKIQGLRFYGIDECEKEDILEMMLSKKYYFCLSWMPGYGCYNPEMVEHDRLQILNYFQNRGYADAVVDLCLEDFDRKDRIVLVINVDKGQCYSVGNMTLEGNCIFTNQQIWDRFNFGIGSRYSPERVRETIEAVTNLYGRWGYIDALVEIQVFLRDCEPVYDIKVSITEGEQYHVGLVKVFGNTCTQKEVILHENLLCPGEVYNQKRVRGTETRLGNTGYFKTVNVYPVQSQLAEEAADGRLYRDVCIELEETDTGNVGLFFGFSSLEQVFGGVQISEQNFNISGIPRLFQEGPSALRGGGEYAFFKVNVGDRLTNYILQWSKPYFLDTPWIFGFDLEKNDNRVFSKGYEIKTYGGSVHGTYLFNDYLKTDLFYKAEHTKVGVSDRNNAALDAAAQNEGFVSSIGIIFMYDSTDSPRRPTDGFKSRFSYELAGIGGNFDYMKFSYLNSYYYPIRKKSVLKFRVDFQFIKTYAGTVPTGLPLSERLFLGGETTVRGYRPYIIGPKFGTNEPAGGVSSMLLSEEYQYTLCRAPFIDLFAFVDAGSVSLKEFTISSLAASVGLGTRIEVMKNAPITLGYGWPIHPSSKVGNQTVNNAQRFFFSMGGNF